MSVADPGVERVPERISQLERIGDRLNAILVKETRQALKSRGFVVTFLLLVLISWVISVFILTTQGAAIEYIPAGRIFFSAFYSVLAIATVLIVPFSTFRSLQEERDHDTFELLQITTLSPRQIVWGKLLSAMVQLFLYYSAITPFIAFASLLQGFDAAQAIFLLTATFFSSVMICMFALMLSTMAKGKGSQGLSALVILGGLGILIMSSVGNGFAMVLGARLPFDRPEFWWGVSFALIGALSYFFLFQQIAITQLTFETDNRSTGIRVVVTIQFLLLWLGAGLLIRSYEVFEPEVFVVLTVISIIHWTLLGLFFVTEEDSLSNRILRDLPKSGLARLFCSPWMPGGTRGFLLLTIAAFATWWLAMGGIAWAEQAAAASGRAIAGGGGSGSNPLMTVLTFQFADFSETQALIHAMVAYLMIYLGIAAGLSVLFQRIDLEKPALVARVVTLFIFAASVLVPIILKAVEYYGPNNTAPQLIDVVNPFMTLLTIGSSLRGSDEMTLVYLAVLTGAMVLITLANAIAAISGLRDVITDRTRLEFIPPEVPVTTSSLG